MDGENLETHCRSSLAFREKDPTAVMAPGDKECTRPFIHIEAVNKK